MGVVQGQWSQFSLLLVGVGVRVGVGGGMGRGRGATAVLPPGRASTKLLHVHDEVICTVNSYLLVRIFFTF